MANTVPNPYNYQTPLGQALGNALQATGTALATGPTQWDQQKDQAAIDLAAAQAGEARAKTAGLTATNAAGGNLGTALKHGLQLIAAGQKPADAYNEIAPEVMQYFAELNPGNTDMGKNILSLYSQLPGVTEQGISQAQEGAGQAFNTTPVGAGRVIVADQAKQDSVNAQSGANNEADNAMRQLIANMEESGRNSRFSVNTGPDTITTLAPGNPLGQTSIAGPSIAMPKAQLEAQTSTANNAATNAASVQNNEADNAMRQLIANTEETGRNNRFSVNTGPDTITTLASGNPLGQTSIAGPSIAMPKAQLEAQTSTANNAATNAASVQNNEADNAMRLLVEQASQAGQNQRMSVQTAPGGTTSLPPNSPIGQTQIQGAPTTETARGKIVTDMDNAGQFVDPNEPMVPGSPAAVGMGMTGVPGQKTGKNWITNDGLQMGITLDGVTDAATGHPLPQGAVVAGDKSLNPAAASTGKNWASPDGGHGVTSDGKTDSATGQPLPAGWQYSTDVNPSGVKLKVIPAGAIQAMLGNKQVINNIDKTITDLTANPDSTGSKGYLASVGGSVGMHALNAMDPDGTNARANVANIGSLIIHDRSGAAVTISETPRLVPFVPLVTDGDAEIHTKLSRLRAEIKSMLSDQFNSYSPDSGYIQNDVVGKFLDTDTDPNDPNGAVPNQSTAGTTLQEGATIRQNGHTYKVIGGKAVPQN